MNSGRFAINVLSTHQRKLSKHFSTPAHHKFTGIHFENGLGGCPVLPESVANFECRTETTVDGGDHVIFIGRIERASYREGHPLIFSAGRYWEPSVLEEAV
jgi:flavin reductase (DIM6/NTAB) family NADH-FMN oxidoreductase RutF